MREALSATMLTRDAAEILDVPEMRIDGVLEMTGGAPWTAHPAYLGGPVLPTRRGARHASPKRVQLRHIPEKRARHRPTLRRGRPCGRGRLHRAAAAPGVHRAARLRGVDRRPGR